MTYTKIDNKTIAETKEVQIKYDIDDIKNRIAFIDTEITILQAEKVNHLSILTEMSKLGILESTK